MSEEELEEVIIARSKEKAEDQGGDWTKYVRGQRFYIENLLKYASIGLEDVYQLEYENAFPDVASEDELLSVLRTKAHPTK